jgi:hypothetical protein
MKKARIGDIIEIPTAQGLAYAQYTHQHPMMGGLIRVFNTLYESRPDNLNTVLNDSVRFSIFFPVNAAVSRHIFEVVGNHEVSSANRSFPLFRCGATDPKTRKVPRWWLWDGEKEWQVGELTIEQRKLPIRSAWNDVMLVERIESGWRPETDLT